MSSVSKESKVLLFVSLVLAFVVVPIAAAPNHSPETSYIAVGGSLALMILAAIFFIAGIERLRKEGAIYVPPKPLVPASAVLLSTMAGVAVSFAIIHYADLLGNVFLTFWVFLLCAGLGGFAGLYMAGLRFSMKLKESDMEQEIKEQQIVEPAIHRGEWLVFGFGAFVVSVLIALMLQLNKSDAPIYPVILGGGLLMMFGFLRSAKPRETTGKDQPEK